MEGSGVWGVDPPTGPGMITHDPVNGVHQCIRVAATSLVWQEIPVAGPHYQCPIRCSPAQPYPTLNGPVESNRCSLSHARPLCWESSTPAWTEEVVSYRSWFDSQRTLGRPGAHLDLLLSSATLLRPYFQLHSMLLPPILAVYTCTYQMAHGLKGT